MESSIPMFRSKARPIVIPQYEHGRLAGTIAQHWGNDQFDRPSLNFASFVQGVALHDWHYGFGDNSPIIEAAEAEWLAMTQRGLEMRLPDRIADIVAKLHLRRLLSYDNSPQRRAMMAQIDGYVQARLPQSGHTRAEFDWADKITHLCDNVAFHFSFEVETEQVSWVCARVLDWQETAITYHIGASGHILMEPWPFNAPPIAGILLGYQAEGYPDELNPVVIPFRLDRLSGS
jgi:hypothetical protein